MNQKITTWKLEECPSWWNAFYVIIGVCIEVNSQYCHQHKLWPNLIHFTTKLHFTNFHCYFGLASVYGLSLELNKYCNLFHWFRWDLRSWCVVAVVSINLWLDKQWNSTKLLEKSAWDFEKVKNDLGQIRSLLLIYLKCLICRI